MLINVFGFFFFIFKRKRMKTKIYLLLLSSFLAVLNLYSQNPNPNITMVSTPSVGGECPEKAYYVQFNASASTVIDNITASFSGTTVQMIQNYNTYTYQINFGYTSIPQSINIYSHTGSNYYWNEIIFTTKAINPIIDGGGIFSVTSGLGGLPYWPGSVTLNAKNFDNNDFPSGTLYNWSVSGGNFAISGPSNQSSVTLTAGYQIQVGAVTLKVTHPDCPGFQYTRTTNIYLTNWMMLGRNKNEGSSVNVINNMNSILSNNIFLTEDTDTDLLEKDIKLFPVPANNYLNISVNSKQDFGIYTLDIYSSDMRFIKSLRVNKSTSQINLEALKNGVYYLRFNINKKVVFKKIIIKK